MMSATKTLGHKRRLRKLKALGREKAAMYQASMRGDRQKLHEASGEFLAIARELGMSDAEAVRAADIEGRPGLKTSDEIPMIRGRKLLTSDEWFQEGEP